MVKKNRGGLSRKRGAGRNLARSSSLRPPNKNSSKVDKKNVEIVDVAPTKNDFMDFDRSAYHVHNKLETGFPCLTFDTIPDQLGRDPSRSETYPISFTMVAGNQVPSTIRNNTIYVMKIEELKQLRQDESDDISDDSEADELNDEEEDEKKDKRKAQLEEELPRLNLAKMSHNGNVNRIRAQQLGERTFAATWSDKSIVYIYDLSLPLQAVNNYRYKRTYIDEKVDPKSVFEFKGHRQEGFALDWCKLEPGTLASGDCSKEIYVWRMQNSSNGLVGQISKPLLGHTRSVEDLKWSPDHKNLLVSCSVDKSIRFWDLRSTPSSVQVLEKCHDSDVNVIDWNRLNFDLIVSGGDDGVVKVWDRRYMSTSGQSMPVASFQFHKKPITSVEWHPEDDTVFAASSEDDRITIWDLAVEPDVEATEADQEMLTVDNKEIEKDVEMKEQEEKICDTDSESSSSDESDYEEDEDADENEDEDEDKEEDGVGYGAVALAQTPPQILFIHEGQKEIKELHWHPQLPGIIISTASDGFNIFRTISA